MFCEVGVLCGVFLLLLLVVVLLNGMEGTKEGNVLFNDAVVIWCHAYAKGPLR